MGAATLNSRYNLAVTFLVVGLLVALVWPSMGDASGAAKRVKCINNMRQIAVAIDAYTIEHGHFPPPYLTDDAGKPMHSWRVLILPYLGETTLYERYDFNKAWDHPDNLRLGAAMPSVYRCPGDERYRSDDTTSYAAVVGDESVWPPSGTRTVGEVTDGMSKTILIVELPDARMHWMAPADPTFDSMLESISKVNTTKRFEHPHQGLSVMTFCDARTTVADMLRLDDRLRTFLTCAGGETLGEDNP
jgi:hypothetical protein